MGESDPITLEALLRDLGPAVLGALMRRFGDFASAEDAVQEALFSAARQWRAEGLPDNPRGWMIQVAVRRLTDQWRGDLARREREAVYFAENRVIEKAPVPMDRAGEAEQDDMLILLFMCCHPAIDSPSAIALTLRAVGGLTTAEIANAFLLPVATMAQRIGRAKQKIKDSAIPFVLPTEKEKAERLGSVLHVLYLIFNEGYASSVGPHLQRSDLAWEAIRLAREVHKLLPEHCEVAGLLALMLLTDARRKARTGPEGELISLADQDRSLWDQELITEGSALLSAALTKGAVGPFQLQAAIAAVHDEAAQAADTDWPQILALYRLLKGMLDSPMVALNHAIAAAMVHGPLVGLDLVAKLDVPGCLAGHYRLDAVRAHFHEMANNDLLAKEHYLRAAARTSSAPERDYLHRRVSRLLIKREKPEGRSPKR